ncbi:MAG: sugar phosphate isomerase/epimerase [Clostridia bacterium]|nr:sugar phosphate isomerase/epimerase [Clostridia bacterium]
MLQNIRLCAFADEAYADRHGQIKALTENGIPYLEIRGVDGVNIADLSREVALQFKSELDAVGIKVWSIGSPAGKTNIQDDFDKALEQFRRLLDMAEIFEAKRIRLFSFYGTDGADENFDVVCRRLNVFCDLCEEKGIIPCHENEKGIYGDIAPRCLALHRAVPRLKAVFDPANFIQCGQDVMEAWEMLAPYVEYGHIKDAASDGHIVPPGDGIGHLSEYLPLFAAQGGEVLTLEPHLAEFVGLKALEGEQDRSEVGGLNFENNRAAFDHAVMKLKTILQQA